MPLNLTSIETSSNGAWQGDNPLHYAFPLLILQTLLIIAISRLLSILLKPLRQPNVTAEILGGILLGPSLFGRKQEFLAWVFPPWSAPILQSAASIGLLFFLFLVGLELDLTVIRRHGRKAFPIAIAGVVLPFALATAVTLVLRRTFHNTSPYPQTLVFIGVSLSITAFPVLARILAELKLLTTPVGQTAMAVAAFNDVAAWVLLALALALTSGNNPSHGHPLTTIWIVLSAAAFVTFMLIVVRPLMGLAINWRSSGSEDDGVDEVLTCLTLAGVMVSGFITDLIGIHSIFGAFVFGLSIPKTGDFAVRLTKMMEDFVSTLLLPLYFASSGLKTDVSRIQGGAAWGLLVLVTSAACAGKILGTFVAAMLCLVPARESLTLGLLMNTKGLVELIVLNIGLEKKVLNTEMFTILVLMAMFTTFMTTPLVLAIYKPAHQEGGSFGSKLHQPSNSNRSWVQKDEEYLRVLCCVRAPGNVPSIFNLIHLIRGTNKSAFKLYAMQLVELTDRSSSILMLQRAQKNGMPFIRRFSRGKPKDQVSIALKAYAEINGVTVRPATAISGLQGMHQDICHVARHKRTAIVILPFHKQWSGEDEKEFENVGHGWKMVNQRVLQNAPCSIGIFVDRGFGSANSSDEEKDNLKRICVLFLGGPNDREALELAGRMSKSDIARVTIIRFVIESHTSTEMAQDKELDEAVVVEFRQRWGSTVEYAERTANDILNEVVGMGKSGEYDLIMVGNGMFPATIQVKLANQPIESPDLGPIGDVLASTKGVSSSVFVIQHRGIAHVNENSGA